MPGFVVNAEGGAGIASAPENTEYYYTYTWEIEQIISDVPSGQRSHLVNVKEMTLPVFTTTKETVMGASLEYKFAKSVNWDDVKITWYDTAGMLATIKQWRETIWDQEYGIATVDTYKQESRLTTYLPDYTAVNRWVLMNSWPSQIKHGDLTYTSSDIKIVEVTLTYDWAVEEPGSVIGVR